MATTRLSSKGQVVLPRDIRDRLRLQPGEDLVVELRGDEVVLHRAPRSWAEWGFGLGRHVWEGVDVDKYIRKERRSWRKRRLP